MPINFGALEPLTGHPRVLGVREDLFGEFPGRFFQRFRFPGDSPLEGMFFLLV